MSNIQITDVTNAAGTGVFDSLMTAVNTNILTQFEDGRITGNDFATVYLGALQSTLTEALKFSLTQEKAGYDADIAANQSQLTIGQTAKIYADTALVGQQQETELAQTTDATGGHMLAKQNLIDAQALGFASDTKQKVLKQMFEGFAVNLSIAGSGTIPDTATEPAIDAVVFEILNDVGSTALTHSGGAPDVGI